MVSLAYIDKIIDRALEEDMNYGDITTDSLVEPTQRSKGKMIAKEAGIIAGMQVAERVFAKLDSSTSFTILKNDGEQVNKGDIVAEIEGRTAALLKGERTALNLLQRLSGIASMTNSLTSPIKHTKAKIVDTRKTTVGLRVLEKYAVRVGGGFNHRFNLSDAVLIKDNHIQAVGGIKEAILRARKNIPHTMKIEIEVERLEQLEAALEARADIIMLDNMSIDKMKKAVEITAGKALLEASGNISADTIQAIAETGVDLISCGALTHSVKALDISMRF